MTTKGVSPRFDLFPVGVCPAWCGRMNALNQRALCMSTDVLLQFTADLF